MDLVEPDTKPCPYCGEEIKKVAIRCKHCQADLTAPDFTRGAPTSPTTTTNPGTVTQEEFEQKFFEYAFKTTATINVPSVSHALRLPSQLVDDRLEDLAARDVILRDIDDEGNVFFTLPGKRSQRLPASPPLAMVTPPGAMATTAPPEGTAVAALVLNIMLPGVGSLVAGRTGIGIGQLVMWVVGLPLCFVLIGFPMVLAAWIWSLVSGIQILEDSKRRQSPT